jgi:hypothetical protein
MALPTSADFETLLRMSGDIIETRRKHLGKLSDTDLDGIINSCFDQMTKKKGSRLEVASLLLNITAAWTLEPTIEVEIEAKGEDVVKIQSEDCTASREKTMQGEVVVNFVNDQESTNEEGADTPSEDSTAASNAAEDRTKNKDSTAKSAEPELNKSEVQLPATKSSTEVAASCDSNTPKTEEDNKDNPPGQPEAIGLGAPQSSTPDARQPPSIHDFAIAQVSDVFSLHFTTIRSNLGKDLQSAFDEAYFYTPPEVSDRYCFILKNRNVNFTEGGCLNYQVHRQGLEENSWIMANGDRSSACDLCIRTRKPCARFVKLDDTKVQMRIFPLPSHLRLYKKCSHLGFWIHGKS